MRITATIVLAVLFAVAQAHGQDNAPQPSAGETTADIVKQAVVAVYDEKDALLGAGVWVNSQDLIDAAVLAAHFSKGKNDSLVDVTHTFAKHVRKPKGAAPGLVTISGGSTITVNPADARLSQLLQTEIKK